MKNKTILIVDDEIESIQAVIACFEKQNAPYNFVMAKDGEMALTLVNNATPDLIVIDWEMPKISGIDVIHEIKKDVRFKHIPVVMLTGKMTSINHLQEALTAGAIDFVRKPFDEVELFSRVQAALQFANAIKENQKNQQKLIENEKQLLDFKSRELTHELEKQRQEMLTSAMHLMQLSEINEKSIQLLNKLYSHTKKTGFSILQELINIYKSSLNRNHLQSFELRFNNVHQDFDKTLQEKFPSMTSTDRRLCALLRLNMSSKDIAVITSLQEQSVNQARSRIRKKLNLAAENNLVDFLSKLEGKVKSEK